MNEYKLIEKFEMYLLGCRMNKGKQYQLSVRKRSTKLMSWKMRTLINSYDLLSLTFNSPICIDRLKRRIASLDTTLLLIVNSTISFPLAIMIIIYK
jgi:hypothetical protein